MGNVLTMAAICFQSSSSGSSSVVKLVFWEGKTTILKSSPTTTTSSSGSKNNNNNNSNSHHQNKIIAGEIMFQFPDKMICHADSFYIGQTIPALSISDQLHPGQTYFVLPIDLFAFKNLSISSLSLLANTCSQSSNSSTSTSTNGKPKSPTLNFSQEAPFQYVKGVDGKMLIKVLPEFLLKLILSRGEGGECIGSDDGGSPNGNNSFLCSTPELKKHYDLLVGCTKENVWSPKLETISEAAINKGGRFSPYRLSPYRLIAGGSPYRLQA